MMTGILIVPLQECRTRNGVTIACQDFTVLVIVYFCLTLDHHTSLVRFPTPVCDELTAA